MDAVAWVVLALIAAASLIVAAFAPRMRRRNLDRRLAGSGGSFGGVGAGFDAG